MNKAQMHLFLKDSYLFSAVSKKGLGMIENYVKENTYKKGEVVFNEGDSGDSLHIITKGVVKIIKYSKEGKTKTLAILKEKDSFGEMALLTKESRSATVETLEKVDTLSITRENFEHMISKEPSISLQIIKTLSERLAKADRDIKILALGDAKSKIACVLADFKNELDIVKFTHQELADLAGLTRETATRTLKQLVDEGVVETKNRQITVTNYKKLEDLCM